MGRPSDQGVHGQRFLTLNTVVRVNQIEVTRDSNLGAGRGGHPHAGDRRSLPRCGGGGWPGAAITWA